MLIESGAADRTAREGDELSQGQSSPRHTFQGVSPCGRSSTRAITRFHTRVRGDISVDFDEIIGSVKCLNHGFHVGSFSVSCPAFHWCVDGTVPTELDTLVEGGLVTKVTEMLLLGGETHN